MVFQTLRALAVVMAMSVGASCASKTSGTSEDAVAFDCRQTVACDQLQGAGISASVTDCISGSKAMLDHAGAEQQEEFNAAVERCQSLAGCAYVTCATNPTTSYSAIHRQDIANDCNQQALCKISAGQPVGNTAVNDCVAQESTVLDSMLMLQAAFSMKLADCAGRTGCDWTNNCK